MKRKCILYLGALVVFLLVLSALMEVVQAAEKKEVTIGYASSLTGKFGVLGNEVHRTYQFWLEQINKEGGLLVGDKRLPVKVTYYDDEGEASTCVKLYERLITSDKVDLILSPWSAQINFAASAVAEKYRYPILLSSAAATSIFERGFKYIFQTTTLHTAVVEPWLSFLKAYNKEIKTVVIIYENILFTVAMNESLSKLVQEAGAKLLFSEKFPAGAKDFAGILVKVKDLNPDALFVLSVMPASVYAARQADEVGVTPKMLMINIGPMYRKEFIEGLGKLSEKVYESGMWHPGLPYAGAKKFGRDFEEKFKKPATTDAAWAYVACQVLEQAIKKAGTIDREKINETLHKEKFETISGSYEYDERGVNKAQRGFICQVQNKERVIVWPKDFANAKPELMR